MPVKFYEICLLLNKMQGYKAEHIQTMNGYMRNLQQINSTDQSIYKKLKDRQRHQMKLKRSFFQEYFTSKSKEFIGNIALIKRKVVYQELKTFAKEFNQKKKTLKIDIDRNSKRSELTRKQLTPRKVCKLKPIKTAGRTTDKKSRVKSRSVTKEQRRLPNQYLKSLNHQKRLSKKTTNTIAYKYLPTYTKRELPFPQEKRDSKSSTRENSLKEDSNTPNKNDNRLLQSELIGRVNNMF